MHFQICGFIFLKQGKGASYKTRDEELGFLNSSALMSGAKPAFKDISQSLLPSPLLKSQPWPTPGLCDFEPDQYPTVIKEIIDDFVESLDYCPEDSEPITDTNATYQAVRAEFLTRYDNGNEWFDSIYKTAAAMAEVCKFVLRLILRFCNHLHAQLSYPGLAPELRHEIARFSWYLLTNISPAFP